MDAIEKKKKQKSERYQMLEFKKKSKKLELCSYLMRLLSEFNMCASDVCVWISGEKLKLLHFFSSSIYFCGYHVVATVA